MDVDGEASSRRPAAPHVEVQAARAGGVLVAAEIAAALGEAALELVRVLVAPQRLRAQELAPAVGAGEDPRCRLRRRRIRQRLQTQIQAEDFAVVVLLLLPLPLPLDLHGGRGGRGENEAERERGRFMHGE